MSLAGTAWSVAGDERIVPQLYELLEKEGIRTTANPDVYVRVHSSFGVDDARGLRERASLGALGGGHRVFIVVADSMTNEAQNALLKVYEEPPADAAFFLVLPSPETLLPTLRSRLQTLRIDVVVTPQPLRMRLSVNPVEVHTHPDAQAFLAARPKERLALLEPLLEKGDDDKRDMGSIFAFLSSIERALAKHPEGLLSVYRARKYAGDRGALIKPLLEQVALLVPVIK